MIQRNFKTIYFLSTLEFLLPQQLLIARETFQMRVSEWIPITESEAAFEQGF
jgi:hypothetical protein